MGWGGSERGKRDKSEGIKVILSFFFIIIVSCGDKLSGHHLRCRPCLCIFGHDSLPLLNLKLLFFGEKYLYNLGTPCGYAPG